MKEVERLEEDKITQSPRELASRVNQVVRFAQEPENHSTSFTYQTSWQGVFVDEEAP